MKPYGLFNAKSYLCIYTIDPLLYRKILHDKITEKCKLDHDNVVDQIYKDTYNFTEKLNTKNKLGKLNRKYAYIILRIINRNLKIINRLDKLTLQKLS